MISQNVLKTGLVALSAGLLLALSACSEPEPVSEGAPPGIRRLTEVQYRNTIRDLFGADIRFGGLFDPLLRSNGLLTVGARTSRITPAGMENYDRMARAIAAQVVNENNRRMLVPCTPADIAAPDDACARAFFTQAGRMLFRRAPLDEEIDATMAIARDAAVSLESFYDGLAAGLAGMLVNPSFLFIVEATEPDPEHSGAVRLTGYAKAARLSYFLWDSTPDAALLDAAERGDLHSEKGLGAQVERMIASSHLEQGVRAFFNDMLAFDEFDKVEKDSIIYPAFSAAVARDAKEQTLRTLIDVLVTNNGDYRDVFTTRKTFMSGPLGRIYRVPVTRPDGGWMPYEFPENDPRAGLITQVSFAALYSHPGRSSPTIRGRAIRESLLCQKIPDPPGDVDFSLFNDPDSPNKTARDRLSAHSTQPACAGCHKLTDPIGLAMEQIDGAGQFRTTESGVEIDPTGDLDGVPYSDAKGLGVAMRDNPALPACIVNRVFSYGTARDPVADRDVLSFMETNFTKNGYKFTDLLSAIATSDAFFAIMPPSEEPADSQPAATSAALTGKSAELESKS